MKPRLFILLILSLLICSCTTDKEKGQVDRVFVSVETGYEFTTLAAEQTLSFGATELTITSVPSYFAGCQILKSLDDTPLKGTMTTDSKMLIYVLSTAATLPDNWIVLQSCKVNCAKGEDIVTYQVFQKIVTEKNVVEIPVLENGADVMVLARTIEIK